MDLDKLFRDGRLKSLTVNDHGTSVEEKVPPHYHIAFVVKDKRLKAQKKASTLVNIDVTVPQELVGEVLEKITAEIDRLRAEEDSKREVNSSATEVAESLPATV